MNTAVSLLLCFACRLTLSLFFVALTTLFSSNGFAQKATPPPLSNGSNGEEGEKEQLEAAKADPKRQKTIALFIGVEQQEKLPFLPPGAKFKGDYKKVTKLG
jgi:hypothetical protein